MNRRRSLLGISSAEYIKDGLILYCDAIQNQRSGHSDSPSDWQDLSGNGNDGVLVGDVQYRDNHYAVRDIKVDNEQSCILFTQQDLKVKNDISFTMQFVFSIGQDSPLQTNNLFGMYQVPTINEQFWATTPQNGYGEGVGLRFFNRRYPDIGYTSYNRDIHIPMMLSITFDAASQKLDYYLNEDKIYTTAPNTNDNYYGMSIGCYLGKTGDGYSNWYSIRYYNKALTDEEVVNNFNYDKRRYNII